MPSLVCASDKVTSSDVSDTYRQCITIVEKKVRNLEKRKARLDLYKTEKTKLNEDQKEAVSKYDVVLQNLDFARDLQKQFQSMLVESTNVSQKQDRRDKYERQQHEGARLKMMLQFQTVLSALSKSSVRTDFLLGRRGAVVLTEPCLQQLGEIRQLIQHPQDLSNTGEIDAASEHIIAFLDGKDTPVAGTTYKGLCDVMHQILECGYFSHPLPDPAVENNSGNADQLSCGTTVSSLTSDEQSKPASLLSSPPSPLSCHSLSGASPLSIQAAVDATVSEDKAAAAINGQHAADKLVKISSENIEEFSFVFDTDDHISATAVVPVCDDKNIDEVVSGFESHFNFLQESLVDNETWPASNSLSLCLTSTAATTYSSACNSCTSDNTNYLPSSSASYIDSSCYTATLSSTCNDVSLPLSLDNSCGHAVQHPEAHYTPGSIECNSAIDASGITFTAPFDVVNDQPPSVTYPNQYSSQLMTTMPYIAPAMVADPYFTQQSINYGHRVAYTTAYGPVMPTYTEPQVAGSHMPTVPCVFPDASLNEGLLAAYPDEGVQDVAYFQGTEIYAEPYQTDGDLITMPACDSLPSTSFDNPESSGLNPNASEFHSRFASSVIECEQTRVDHGNEESDLVDAPEHAELNECSEDCGQFGFRGRGRGFHGAPRGGRFNHNRGGFARHRNFQRDGYPSDYYNSSWRGNRGRGMYSGRGGNRGYGRNIAAHQETRD